MEEVPRKLLKLIEKYEDKGELTQKDCSEWKMEHIYIERTYQFGPRTYTYTHHGIRIYYRGHFVSILHLSGLSEEISLRSKMEAKIMFVGSDANFAHPSPKGRILVKQSSTSHDVMNRLINTFLERDKILYHLLTSNCEHVSTYIIEGKWSSSQSDEKFLKIAEIIGHKVVDNQGVIWAGIGAAIGFFMAYQAYNTNKEETKKKTIKSTGDN